MLPKLIGKQLLEQHDLPGNRRTLSQAHYRHCYDPCHNLPSDKMYYQDYANQLCLEMAEMTASTMLLQYVYNSS